MRIWLHLFLVLLSCSLVYLQKPAPLPEAEMQRKAQALLDSYYGAGHSHVCVTLRQGRGQRTVRDQQLGEKGFVVSTQDKHETYQGRYVNDSHAEKLELPRKLVVTHQDQWLESADVAVVVDRDPGLEIVPLLEAGLGLHSQDGNLVRVVRAQK